MRHFAERRAEVEQVELRSPVAAFLGFLTESAQVGNRLFTEVVGIFLRIDEGIDQSRQTAFRYDREIVLYFFARTGSATEDVPESQLQSAAVDKRLEELLAVQGGLAQAADELLHGDFTVFDLGFQIRDAQAVGTGDIALENLAIGRFDDILLFRARQTRLHGVLHPRFGSVEVNLGQF